MKSAIQTTITNVSPGEDPRTITPGKNYWVGNAIATGKTFSYNVFCGATAPSGGGSTPVGLEQQALCCMGLADSSVNCGGFQSTSGACQNTMNNYVIPMISSTSTGATAQGITYGNNYLGQIGADDTSGNRANFASGAWNTFWTTRGSNQPNGYTNDYDTFINLTEDDSNNLNALIDWCASSGNGQACSGQVTAAGSGICNGPSSTAPLTRESINPYTHSSPLTKIQRQQLTSMCGCNLNSAVSTNYPIPALGISCDPICATPNTIQNASVGSCPNTVCVIDQLSINLAKASSINGGVTINQICTGKGASCYIDYAEIDAINSSLNGGLNINQQCTACFDVANPLQQYNCATGEECSGEECNVPSDNLPNSISGAISRGYEWLKARPSIAIAIAIVVGLGICLIIWGALKLLEGREDYSEDSTEDSNEDFDEDSNEDY